MRGLLLLGALALALGAISGAACGALPSGGGQREDGAASAVVEGLVARQLVLP